MVISVLLNPEKQKYEMNPVILIEKTKTKYCNFLLGNIFLFVMIQKNLQKTK